MNYGFVIDNRLCIGCHACSTACKSENEVPLGVNRTWVKYVETGVFPDSSRHFQVTRCNHCANPPCVEICPVTAMFKRSDGIVDFDGDACIGCKACIQACPYDAIYIDPDSLTAAKCHYCAHRTEIGLEPACVVVCPEQAIISGDIDDPHSKIRQLIDNNQVKVRKPEIGTKPNLFYIEGSSVTLDPIASVEIPSTYMWSDVEGENKNARIDKNSNEVTKAATDDGPVKIGGKVAEHMVQVSYDVGHKKAWHWPVAAYLTTKAIASGTYLMLMCAMAMGVASIGGVISRVMSLIVLVAMVATGVLLCVDLERPERFLRVITRPQWRSWLSRGAWILVGFGGIVISILGINLAAWLEIRYVTELESMLLRPTPLLAWGGVSSMLAICVAIYTAYLFRQAKGRDLWQGKYLPLHMGVQAAIAGSAVCILLIEWVGGLSSMYNFCIVILSGGIAISAFIVCSEHIVDKSRIAAVRMSNQAMVFGDYRIWFWVGGIFCGHLLPLTVLFAGGAGFGTIVAVGALCGLFCYEYAFILAGQSVPNS